MVSIMTLLHRLNSQVLEYSDEGARNGFVSRIAGIGIHSSPEFTVASTAVKGGVFVPEAIGIRLCR